MILLADSGSTKTSWCLKNDGKEDLFFHSEGYNPYYLDTPYISNSIKAALPSHLNTDLVSEVHFYGAGCNADKADIVKQAIIQVFPNAQVQVEIDLLAAARSVLGKNAGFVGILGTGTNSCLYNGDKIEKIVNSLGFLMGDEGSGAYMGKQLLIAYAREYMPKELADAFKLQYQLSADDILSKVYAAKMPSTYCASFCLFINEHIKHPFINDIVKNSFKAFFDNIVSYYPNYKNYSFNCVGSIAFNFLPQLKEVASLYEMKIGNIIKNPIDGLIHYHALESKLA